MIAEPATDGDQAAFVRRDYQFEGHVADGHLIACGRDAPAVEQQVLVRRQAFFPADRLAIDVLRGLADCITIGRRREIGAGENDCSHSKHPHRQSSCGEVHSRIFKARSGKARTY